MNNDPLLQPFELRHLRIRNRVFSASHEPAYGENGKPGFRYQLYQEEKARGGVGLTMFGGSTLIARDSPPAFGNLYAGDDEIIPYFRQLAGRVHRHGAAIMCQISHLGRRTSWSTGDWLPLISASRVREPAHRAFPKAMEDFDIRRIVRAYGAAARRCREGDLDGIEIEAYGHLFDSFLSPLTNKRTDDYGGSLDNRLRFCFEVLEEIRRQAGDDFIVGIRFVFDETVEGGIVLDEGMRIGHAFAASGLIDFINVIRGYIGSDAGLSHVIPNMGAPAAPHLELAGMVRREIGLPVFHAARISDVATARHAVREGLVDMVGMVRAHIADPHIIAKIRRGEESRIRPCVGASYCIDRIYVAAEALCIHNPATGREQSVSHVIPAAARRRRVVVVGAGPAGLEAARVSAARGHDVIVFEAGREPGGQLVLASRVARRREIIGIRDWLVQELRTLGVELRLQHWADADMVLAEQPDVVIVATGGIPDMDIVPGTEHAVSTWDVLNGQVRLTGAVLLYDVTGQHQGMSCAEHMAAMGIDLEIVTPDRMIGFEIGGTNYPAYYKTFLDHRVRMTVSRRLRRIDRIDGRLRVELDNEFNGARESRATDHVVIEHGTVPADELYLELRAGSSNRGEVDLDALIAGQPQALVNNPDGAYQLFRVGDAVESRNIHAAIYDSLRLCKDL